MWVIRRVTQSIGSPMKILIAIVLFAVGTFIILNHQGTVSFDVGEATPPTSGFDLNNIPLWVGIVADVTSILLFIMDLASRSRADKKR